MEVAELQAAMQSMMQYREADFTAQLGGFEDHIKNLRGTMFYVCQGSCLCGTVNNRGKVIYCYGDLVPRQGELFSENSESTSRTTPRDLLAAQLGIWVFGLIALLIVLLLIRKSISSLREHIEKVTQQLPWYHDDDDVLSNHSTTSPPIQHKDTTMESMPSAPTVMESKPALPELERLTSRRGSNLSNISDHSVVTTPVPQNDEQLHEPGGFNRNLNTTIGGVGIRNPIKAYHLRALRINKKDYKKSGAALRGKNLMEGYRVKEKDLKKTMR